MDILLYAIVVLWTVLFGAILYIGTHWWFKKLEEHGIEPHIAQVWTWRLSIFLALLFVSALLFLNRVVILEIIIGTFEIFLVSLLVFYVALIEMVIIDLLLPQVIQMWKRIAIEILVFIILVTVTITIFSVYQAMHVAGA